MEVNVKLRPCADRVNAVDRLLQSPGVLNAVQVFPHETDPELAGLYLLQIEDSDVAAALERLREEPEIEYAEEPAPRKLIYKRL